MFKLAGLIIDAYDDPAFVDHPQATGVVPSPEEIARLKDRDFAVIIKTAAGAHRKYPLTTPALVKIAAAYFDECGAKLPEDIRAAAHFRIAEVAAKYGIKIAGAAAAPVPSPAPTRFVFDLIDDGSGRPATPTPLTKTAAAAIVQDELLKRFGRMAPAERALAVSDLCKHAAVDDPRLTPYRPRADFGSRLGEGLRQREFLLGDDQIKLAQFEALIGRFPQVGARAAAVLLDQFDRQAALEGRVLDAYVTCWDGFHKTGAADPMNEDHYRLETLARSHAETVKAVFDEQTASAFLRAPVSFYEREASGSVKRMLRNMAKAVGEQNPVACLKLDLPEARRRIRAGECTPWAG